MDKESSGTCARQLAQLPVVETQKGTGNALRGLAMVASRYQMVVMVVALISRLLAAVCCPCRRRMRLRECPDLGSPTSASRRAGLPPSLHCRRNSPRLTVPRIAPSHYCRYTRTLHHDMSDRVLDPAILAGTSFDAVYFLLPAFFGWFPNSSGEPER